MQSPILVNVRRSKINLSINLPKTKADARSLSVDVH